MRFLTENPGIRSGTPSYTPILRRRSSLGWLENTPLGCEHGIA